MEHRGGGPTWGSRAGAWLPKGTHTHLSTRRLLHVCPGHWSLMSLTGRESGPGLMAAYLTAEPRPLLETHLRSPHLSPPPPPPRVPGSGDPAALCSVLLGAAAPLPAGAAVPRPCGLIAPPVRGSQGAGSFLPHSPSQGGWACRVPPLLSFPPFGSTQLCWLGASCPSWGVSVS